MDWKQFGENFFSISKSITYLIVAISILLAIVLNRGLVINSKTGEIGVKPTEPVQQIANTSKTGFPASDDGTTWRSANCGDGEYVITGKCVMIKARGDQAKDDGFFSNKVVDGRPAFESVPNHAYLVNAGPSLDRKYWVCGWGGVLEKAEVTAYCAKELQF